MLDAETLDVTLLLTDVLASLNIPYVIGGSVASTAHGQIRSTLDVDLVADIKENDVDQFIARLSHDFYVDEATVRQAIQRQSSFNLIHLSTMVKVDVFVPKDRAFDRQQLARRIAERIHPDSSRALRTTSCPQTSSSS